MVQLLSQSLSSLPLRRLGAPILAGTLACFLLGCGVEGSGVIEQKSRPLEGYADIEVEDGFVARVKHGEEFGVTVWADDNIIDDVHVEQMGDSVRLYVDGGVRNATLEAEFTLPLLGGLTARDGSQVEVTDFPLARDVSIACHDGSFVRLSSNEPVASLDLVANDGCLVEVVVNADKVRTELHDGSNVEVEGTTDLLDAEGTDGSQLGARSLAAKDVTIRLADGSNAHILASETVEALLTDGSNLTVSGEATIDAETRDGSNVSRD